MSYHLQTFNNNIFTHKIPQKLCVEHRWNWVLVGSLIVFCFYTAALSNYDNISIVCTFFGCPIQSGWGWDSNLKHYYYYYLRLSNSIFYNTSKRASFYTLRQKIFRILTPGKMSIFVSKLRAKVNVFFSSKCCCCYC